MKNEQVMKQTKIDTSTTTATTVIETKMGNGHKKPLETSVSAHEIHRRTGRPIRTNIDVSKWTSGEVQNWIKEQCRIFELKRNTVDKFEMNGQALILLSKNDFIRRSADGGEVLYYALQQLIKANKSNKKLLDQSSSVNNFSDPKQQPRIVELPSDQEDSKYSHDSSTAKPIIEEPDDPPAIRRSQSDQQLANESGAQAQQPFFARQPPFHRPFIPMQARFFHPAPIPTAGVGYAYPHPHFMHQFHPMMSSQGILIELVDNLDQASSPTNGQQTQLYMVTMNGQRLIMNQAQVTQLVNQVYQRLSLENQHAYVFYQ